MTLRSSLQQWRAALSGLSLRERLLVTVALTALCYAGVDLWLLLPAKREFNGLQKTLQARRTELARLGAATAARPGAAAEPHAQAASSADPDRLATGLEQFGRDLGRTGTPVQWNAELQRLLERHPGVGLTHLKIQPPAPLFSSTELATVLADGAEHPPQLSEAAEFSVQGSYPALQALLGELERLAPAAYWAEARLEAHHPESTLTLVVRQIVPPRVQPR